MERDWLFGIGPLDEPQAQALRDHIESSADNGLTVEMYDPRVWFSGAWDADSVRDVIPVLEAGIAADAIPAEIGNSAFGFLSDLRTWLEREYDSTRDPGEHD